jgi:hypothetical protein
MLETADIQASVTRERQRSNPSYLTALLVKLGCREFLRNSRNDAHLNVHTP